LIDAHEIDTFEKFDRRWIERSHGTLCHGSNGTRGLHLLPYYGRRAKSFDTGQKEHDDVVV
jgi:hypothetical protein